MSTQNTHCHAGKSRAGLIAAPKGAINSLINSLAVNSLRGDSAANNFRLKM
jgi:hypothetical protein